MKETAGAWQFTANDSVRFVRLMMDGVYTCAEGKLSGEKLICKEAANSFFHT